MKPPSRQVRCKIDGCTSKARQRGRCKRHYKLWRKENPEPSQHREPEHRKPFSVNDYRSAWESRKKGGTLGEDWLNLFDFAKGVHPKPGPNHTLCRIRHSEPYGPSNFVWREKIIRQEGESSSDFALRQRVEQLTRFPNFERDRMLRRRYGITQVQYDKLLSDQNGGCAICGRPETSMGRTKKVKCLAVDHCHETGAVRGLLCYYCNVTLGKMGESVERLEAMIRYLKKHAHPALKLVGG